MGTKLVSISIAVTLAVFAVSWLGDQTGSSLYGLPLMAAMALGVFIVQWIGLIHARLFETEHYFDLVGSLTYITVTILAVQQAAEFGLRQQLIAVAVIVWAARLALSCLCGFRKQEKTAASGRSNCLHHASYSLGHYKVHGCSLLRVPHWQPS